MGSDRIVAVGLLTQADIAVLGKGFDRLFPVTNDAAFDDLLRQLESVRPVPEPARKPPQR